MNTRTVIIFAVATGLTIAAVETVVSAKKSASTAPAAPVTMSAQQVPPDPPPYELVHIDDSFAKWFASDYQETLVQCVTLETKVEMSWAASPNWSTQGVTDEVVQQRITSYYPTAAAVVGNTVVVGGKGRGDETIIEAWNYAWPGPNPPGQSGTVDQPNLVSVIELYRGEQVGKLLVREILPYLGSASTPNPEVLVQFDDSRDIYALDLKTHAMSLEVSSSAAGTLQNVADLGKDFHWAWVGEHATEGYVYNFGWFFGTTRTTHLVLRDTDKDGVVDDYLSLSPTEWDASAYADHSTYVTFRY